MRNRVIESYQLPVMILLTSQYLWAIMPKSTKNDKKTKREGELKCTGADDVNVYLERWEDLNSFAWVWEIFQFNKNIMLFQQVVINPCVYP